MHTCTVCWTQAQGSTSLVFLGGQLCPKPMSSCLVSDFPKTMDLGHATFPRQDCMFKYLAKIFSWSSRLLRDILAKFRRAQGVFCCMQLFASKAPCLSPHVVLIWLSSQKHRPFLKENSAFGLNAAICPLKKQGSWLHVHFCQNHYINYLLGLFYVMARTSCNEFYVMTPRSLPQSFWYVMADPCITHIKVVLQMWLLDAPWTAW